ncbi:MAG: dienelactone hydrolase family protein [Burkholderiaceae bacterium]
MTGKWISIKAHDGGEFGGYLSLPPTGTGPGLVVIQEIWGVNEHIRAVADQYASDGYVVIAPDVFWRQKPRVDLKYDEADTAQAYQFMQNLDGANAVKDLTSTVKTLRALPEVKGKVGVLGFCMGGRLSFLAAAQSGVDSAVCYYGGGIQNFLDLAASVKVPILFHYGEKDAHIPPEAVAAVRAAFDGRANARIEVYAGADHGFNCWRRPGYNQSAAALARGRSLEWLATTLA